MASWDTVSAARNEFATASAQLARCVEIIEKGEVCQLRFNNLYVTIPKDTQGVIFTLLKDALEKNLEETKEVLKIATRNFEFED